jgi:hypothetical protein
MINLTNKTNDQVKEAIADMYEDAEERLSISHYTEDQASFIRGLGFTTFEVLEVLYVEHTMEGQNNFYKHDDHKDQIL